MPASRAGAGRTIALVSQSGGLGMSLAQAMERGLSVSHTLTVGNASDATIADFVSYLAEEPRFHAIACVFEGIGDPQRLLHEMLQVESELGRSRTGEVRNAALRVALEMLRDAVTAERGS